MNAKEQLPDPATGLTGDARQLLAGLLRQREDLGPIAEELIELLLHYGVTDPAWPPVDSTLN
ncbi:MAG TPA: hypothetical protein PLW81_05050 [Thiobacillaceae bacterium]|nr:hypothetical protein [Thiobacillaceae bacterium]